MAEIGKGLAKYIAGQTNLPESAAGHKQRPVPEGFAWKPSDEETRRDIERDKKFAPIERELFMANRRDPDKEAAPEPTRNAPAASNQVKMGMGLHRLIQDVKGTVTTPIEALGAEARRQVKSLGNWPEIDLNNLPKKELDKKAAAALATDLLQTTPAGAVAGMLRKMGGEAAEDLAARFDNIIEEINVFGVADEPVVQTGKHSQSDGVSDEVVNWLESRKAQGISRWVVKKDGTAIPLTGINSRDYRVPTDAVLVDVQKGKPQVLDIGQGVPKTHVEGILARAGKNFN